MNKSNDIFPIFNTFYSLRKDKAYFQQNMLISLRFNFQWKTNWSKVLLILSSLSIAEYIEWMLQLVHLGKLKCCLFMNFFIRFTMNARYASMFTSWGSLTPEAIRFAFCIKNWQHSPRGCLLFYRTTQAADGQTNRFVFLWVLLAPMRSRR